MPKANVRERRKRALEFANKGQHHGAPRRKAVQAPAGEVALAADAEGQPAATGDGAAE